MLTVRVGASKRVCHYEKETALAQKKAKSAAKTPAKKVALPPKVVASKSVKATSKKVAAKIPAGKGKKGKGGDVSAPRPSAPPRGDGLFLGPLPDKPLPRATKLPTPDEALNKRAMEQVLTVGVGRGVVGEGSLKGRLVVHNGFPYLEVIGRDKRELYFLLQGPDQEVLPAYVDNKVSVGGLIRRTHNYGGTVDVRKYSAKKPEQEVAEVKAPEDKLRFLSPGEVEQISAAGMGAGMKGYATMRGTLEMTGEDFFLVVSNAGTRAQVSFALEGKGSKGLKRNVGQMVRVTGVIEKTSGWGGTVQVESCEPRGIEFKGVTREAMSVVGIDGKGDGGQVELKVNDGLSVKLQERAGFIWAIEPTMAKRVSLRESNFHLHGGGPAVREFFFTPRNPGMHEIDFFLAKAFTPTQVTKTFKLAVHVKPGELA